jgi:hypothetical protein
LAFFAPLNFVPMRAQHIAGRLVEHVRHLEAALRLRRIAEERRAILLRGNREPDGLAVIGDRRDARPSVERHAAQMQDRFGRIGDRAAVRI